ncbi:hypothetical protein YC2023_102695 [Brassica napus]
MFPINDIGFQVWILWCAVGPPSSRLSGSMVFVYGEPTLRRLCAAFSSSPFMVPGSVCKEPLLMLVALVIDQSVVLKQMSRGKHSHHLPITPVAHEIAIPFLFGRRKRWGEKISFEAWAKFSCALVVSVKQISGPLLLYDDRVYRWVSSSRTNQIVGGSPPRPNIESTVALLLDDDESNRRWLFSSTRNQIIGGFCRGGSIRMLLLLKSKDLKSNRDGVIEEHDLQVKRLEDKITQLIRLVLLLPQALPLAMDQERRGRFVINKDEKINTGNTFVFG